MPRSLLVCLLALPVCNAQISVAFPDFSRPLGLNLAGHAEITAGRLRLTPATTQTAGAAWYVRRLAVKGGFETEFQFQITDRGGLDDGADGFALVLQNSSAEAIAGPGRAGGFAVGGKSGQGIPNSIAVFFDTRQNPEQDDPSDNYIGLVTHGRPREQKWPPARLGESKRLKVKLKDGKLHSARVSYRPPVITVSLDGGPPVLTAVVDLKTVTDAAGTAFVGFTASTGEGFENHDILSWRFSPTPHVESDISIVSSTISFQAADCMEGRNLCTPPAPTVEALSPGEYRIVLPAHLEWAAGIPNPTGAPVEITQLQGTVCLERAAESCGPGKPGDVITRNANGQTYFSVNDKPGKAFADNQGYFEFRVRVGR